MIQVHSVGKGDGLGYIVTETRLAVSALVAR